MENKKRNSIFRGVLASIIGSRLTSSDLRMLAELLDSDRNFSRELGRAIYEISKISEPQPSFLWNEEIESESTSPDDSLVSLAYNVVQRKRMPKRELAALISSISPKIEPAIATGMSAKEALREFFSFASTSQRRRLLRELGMDVSEDPYLGGITRRSQR